MKILEIDGMCDLKIKLEINSTLSLSNISKYLKVRMSVFIKSNYEPGSTAFLKFFIYKPLDPEIKSLLLNSFSGIEKENYIVIIKDFMDSRIIELINKLNQVPTLIMSETTVEEGKLILRMRINHNFIGELSSLLSGYISIPYFIDDILIGKNEGLQFLLSKKNARIPLYFLKYSVPIALLSDDPDVKIIAGSDCVINVHGMEYPDSAFNSLIFSKDKLLKSDNMKKLMENDNIYQFYFKNEFLSGIREIANDHGIFRNDEIIKINGNNMEGFLTIASSMIMDYVDILFSSSMSYFKKNVITINIICPFDSELLAKL
ncbi:MAG: hypothetical protein QXZ44_03255 [Ferroplasma sp.]